MPSRPAKSKKSFTLIELIFEIIILALVVISTAALLGQLSSSVVMTEINTVATALTTQKAEEMFWNKDFDTVADETGVFLAPYQEYSYTIDVQNVSAANPNVVVAASSSDYKRATLSVIHASIPDVVVELLFVD